MASPKVLYAVIARRFGMWGGESSEQQDVSVLSLKAKSIRIIWKEVGAMGAAEFVLVGFNALGYHHTVR